MPGLAKPVRHILVKVFPNTARDIVIAPVESEIRRSPVRIPVRIGSISEVTIELVAFVAIEAVVVRVNIYQRGICAEVDIVNIRPFAKISAIWRERDVG